MNNKGLVTNAFRLWVNPQPEALPWEWIESVKVTNAFRLWVNPQHEPDADALWDELGSPMPFGCG